MPHASQHNKKFARPQTAQKMTSWQIVIHKRRQAGIIARRTTDACLR
ncbi:hypothetical protein OU997_06365 [Pseudomonas sp. SL4(2022)]|nr:hypothetical protein [Pseudomonas sp. SL4(2022)]WAC45787.1 hypothetical protein OU997_06365 [Pseudomonas sp. SL4(2022)]